MLFYVGIKYSIWSRLHFTQLHQTGRSVTLSTQAKHFGNWLCDFCLLKFLLNNWKTVYDYYMRDVYKRQENIRSELKVSPLFEKVDEYKNICIRIHVIFQGTCFSHGKELYTKGCSIFLCFTDFCISTQRSFLFQLKIFINL